MPSRIDPAVLPGRRSLCPSRCEYAAPALELPSSNFLLPNAFKQVQLSCVAVEFLQQVQGHRRLQERIGAGGFTLPHRRCKLIPGEPPAIADHRGQIINGSVACDPESPCEPVPESPVADLDGNRGGSGPLVEPTERLNKFNWRQADFAGWHAGWSTPAGERRNHGRPQKNYLQHEPLHRRMGNGSCQRWAIAVDVFIPQNLVLLIAKTREEKFQIA